MRKWIDLMESVEPRLTVEFQDGMFTLALNGQQIGWFTIDVTHKSEGRVSIHSSIDQPYRHKGYAKTAYDYIEAWLADRNLKLGPSDRLSQEAYRLWQKRGPDLVRDYEERDFFTNGKHQYHGLEKLWYSPYGLRKWNL